jgi:hypothetical protein
MTFTPAARPATRSSRSTTGQGRALLITTRVLLAAFGGVKLVATVYFTFVASAAAGGDPQGAGDWLVAAWSIAMGAGYLALAARLGRSGAAVLPLAVGLTAADLAFSVVKFFVYDETTALGFMGMALLLLGLVAGATRVRR